jgi:hypothetical protein
MDTILVANAGSSSVKFQLFAVERNRDLTRQIRGQVGGVGIRPRLRAAGAAAGSHCQPGEQLTQRKFLPRASHKPSFTFSRWRCRNIRSN